MDQALFDPNSPWFGAPIAVCSAVLFIMGLLWVRFLPVRITVPQGSFGLVTLRPRRVSDVSVVPVGEPGFQAATLPPGSYWTRLATRDIDVIDCLVIEEGELGIVVLHAGEEDAPMEGAAYASEFGDFTDLTAVLAAGGQRGQQVAVLPPGEYAVHNQAFEVLVVTPFDEDNYVYGRSSWLTDELFKLNPYTLESGSGTAIIMRPHEDDETLSIVPLNDGNNFIDYETVEYTVAVSDYVTVTWEVLVTRTPGAKESILDRLRIWTLDTLGSAQWSAGAFAVRVAELELDDQKPYRTARVTEAILLPAVLAQATEDAQNQPSTANV